MGIWHLVRKEISYRRLNFAQAMLGVLVAAAGLVGPMTVLRAYSIRAEKRLGAMQKEYKDLTLQYGFNVRVIPAGRTAATSSRRDTPPRRWTSPTPGGWPNRTC